MITVNAAQRLKAAMKDEELFKYATSLWDYAKTVGPVMNPKFETWFRTRGKQLYRLSDAQLNEVWRAAIKMNS